MRAFYRSAAHDFDPSAAAFRGFSFLVKALKG